MRRIYRRYLDGCSLSQIQQELEADRVPTAQAVQRWSYQVIRNILTNERYIGDAMLGKTFITDCISKRVKKNNGERGQSYVENNHPAIIPRELFYRVQEEMTRRASKRKVMQKTGKTELGKYSAKYALSELLVCGECGTPYKRVTWARNGKKRIVWRCISRLEFGTKYCHNSPTLDEEKLHQAIQEAINEFAQAGTEVKEDMLTFTAMAWGGDAIDGVSLIDLRQKLKDITAQQALLLDQVLEHMDDEILNAQLTAMMDEKQALPAWQSCGPGWRNWRSTRSTAMSRPAWRWNGSQWWTLRPSESAFGIQGRNWRKNCDIIRKRRQIEWNFTSQEIPTETLAVFGLRAFMSKRD